MRETLRIALADDHPIFLTGLETLLRRMGDFTVTSADLDGRSAVESIRKFTPDIAILHIYMPVLTGIQILELVKREGLDTKIIFLTAPLMANDIVAATERGAWGIVPKNSDADTLMQCLKEVAEDNRWLGPQFPDQGAECTSRRELDFAQFEVLTAREQQIAALVAEGLSNKHIAQRLGISAGTVKIHLYNVYQKLGVSNRMSLSALGHLDLPLRSSANWS